MKMNDIENGYIKLFRSFGDWEWHDNESMVTVFIHCLIYANWKDKRWHGHVIERGSFITSVVKLADDCGLAWRTCRKCLDKLQETGEILVETNKHFTKITVKNYAKYQVPEEVGSSPGSAHGSAYGCAQVSTEMHNTMHNSMHITEERKNSKNKEVKDIVLFLNQHANTNYKPSTNKTVTLINARMKEGFKKEDFYTVIQNKCNEWKGTKMEKYLRPETLFGTKFESYLNQNERVSLPFGDVTPDWYTSEPVRKTETKLATQEEIDAVRALMMKGVKKNE